MQSVRPVFCIHAALYIVQLGIRKGEQQMTIFNDWIDTLISEKGIDLDQIMTIPSDGIFGDNMIPVQVVIDAIKSTSKQEQKAIKKTLVMIDFKNGDILHYIKHLAQAIAI